MRLSAIHDFLFELLRRKHEKMLAKHTDKRKACPYDAHKNSIFFAAVGFSCRTLLGRAWKPAPTGLCRCFWRREQESSGFRHPFSLMRTFTLTGESPALRVVRFFTLCEFPCVAFEIWVFGRRGNPPDSGTLLSLRDISPSRGITCHYAEMLFFLCCRRFYLTVFCSDGYRDPPLRGCADVFGGGSKNPPNAGAGCRE